MTKKNKTKIAKVLLLVILFIIGGYFLYYQSQLSQVSSQNTNHEDFIIEKGQSLEQISNNLKSQGFIKNSLIFKTHIRLLGLSTKLQAGSYRLTPSENSKVIAQKLTKGLTDVRITIPEGWRVEEIADKLSNELAINKEDFLKTSKEGYMFPDTYLIPQSSTAADVTKIMGDNFNQKFDANLQSQLAKSGLTLKELIILASLIEREVKFSNDRPIVAGILFSRLEKGLALEVDATVQYALGYQQNEKTYWKKNLALDDIKINSPYNTRKFTGLPPDPICSPGLAAIKSVLNPKYSDYLYYLSDRSGKIYYAKTLEEHNANYKYLDF